MVVESVIRHWVKVIAKKKAGAEVLGTSIHDLAAYLYAYGGIFTLTQPERLKKAIDGLTYFFKQVGLQENTRHMVIISYQQCHMPSSM